MNNSEPKLENFNRATLAQEAEDNFPDSELTQLRYIVNQGFGKLQACIDRVNELQERFETNKHPRRLRQNHHARRLRRNLRWKLLPQQLNLPTPPTYPQGS